jgi:hypothetical protein
LIARSTGVASIDNSLFPANEITFDPPIGFDLLTTGRNCNARLCIAPKHGKQGARLGPTKGSKVDNVAGVAEEQSAGLLAGSASFFGDGV